MGLINRIFGIPEARSLDAAQPAKRRDISFSRGINAEPGAPLVAQRGWGGYLNNGHLRSGIEALVGATIGAGIEPVSSDPAALARWREWARDVNLPGLLRTAERGRLVDGEAFAVWDGDRPVLITPAQVSDESRTLADGRLIHRGVEVDATCTPIAFHIHEDMPDSGQLRPPVRMPASEVMHYYEALQPNQIRGLSALAAAILPANELNQLLDALSIRAKMSAALFLSITQENYDSPAASSVVPLEGEKISAGTLVGLAPGERLEHHSAAPAIETAELIRAKVREIAAALQVPAHMIDGDLSMANFSSLRASLIHFRAHVEAIQFSILTPNLLLPMWRRVTLTDAPDEWLMPRWAQVDPLKAVESDARELELGLTSRRRLAAERGWALEQLDAELASEGWKPRDKESDT